MWWFVCVNLNRWEQNKVCTGPHVELVDLDASLESWCRGLGLGLGTSRSLANDNSTFLPFDVSATPYSSFSTTEKERKTTKILPNARGKFAQDFAAAVAVVAVAAAQSWEEKGTSMVAKSNVTQNVATFAWIIKLRSQPASWLTN